MGVADSTLWHLRETNISQAHGACPLRRGSNDFRLPRIDFSQLWVSASGIWAFLCQKSTWFREAVYSWLRYGHHWTYNRTGSYTDVDDGHDFPCGLNRILDNAAKCIVPIPSELRNDFHVPCRSGIVPTDRSSSFVNHSSVWLFWKGCFLQS